MKVFLLSFLFPCFFVTEVYSCSPPLYQPVQFFYKIGSVNIPKKLEFLDLKTDADSIRITNNSNEPLYHLYLDPKGSLTFNGRTYNISKHVNGQHGHRLPDRRSESNDLACIPHAIDKINIDLKNFDFVNKISWRCEETYEGDDASCGPHPVYGLPGYSISIFSSDIFREHTQQFDFKGKATLPKKTQVSAKEFFIFKNELHELSYDASIGLLPQ